MYHKDSFCWQCSLSGPPISFSDNFFVTQELLGTHTKFVKKLEKGCANGGMEISHVFIDFVCIILLLLLFMEFASFIFFLVSNCFAVYSFSCYMYTVISLCS